MYVKEKNEQLHQKGTSEFLRLDSSQLISLLNSNFPINMSESEVKKGDDGNLEENIFQVLIWNNKVL